MDGLTTVQLAQLRAALLAQLATLEGQSSLQVSQQGHQLAVEEVETAPADKATVRLLNDLAIEAAGLHTAQIRSLRQALQRIDEGEYGDCEQCGQAIGFSRLAARPDARLCIRCQTLAEQRR
ncbi:TraR/DksA family transcriptional regulator [Massilia sp. TS11]|uniref:TraR/DksA family transcriptional regulator n=1 Tax=Massilia sp. TS11 TaxID=2908003 RepID=UPI001EDC6CEE|nr:TraR/DksA family transcriptional regulator [Massilia sp. TS11]MCG2584436.1 TraR/DksA family transcriptional regulator [Massilia sp. TS11]